MSDQLIIHESPLVSRDGSVHRVYSEVRMRGRIRSNTDEVAKASPTRRVRIRGRLRNNQGPLPIYSIGDRPVRRIVHLYPFMRDENRRCFAEIDDGTCEWVDYKLDVGDEVAPGA